MVNVMKSKGLKMYRACYIADLPKSTFKYKSEFKIDFNLIKKILDLADKFKRFGYRRIHRMLMREGVKVNHKKVQRIYQANNLQVRSKRRKKITRERIPLSAPMYPNERWSMDFVSDSFSDGRKFRVLNIVDDYTKEAVAMVVDTSISGRRICRELDQICLIQGKPKSFTTDNGPEFTSNALDEWTYSNGVKLDFIQPGKPTQNAFVESFNGKFREECLNQTWFKNKKDAVEKIEEWRSFYNNIRPHSSLDYRTPSEFIEEYYGSFYLNKG